MTAKINCKGDVYQFAEQVKAASQQLGETGLYEQHDRAMQLGSSGSEILGACVSAPDTVNNAEARAESVLGILANRLKCTSTLPVQIAGSGF